VKAEGKTDVVLYKYKQIKVKLLRGCRLDFGQVGVRSLAFSLRASTQASTEKSNLYTLICRHISNDFSPRPFRRLVFTIY